MKIRTVEDLQDKLDDDLSWRKKELLNFNLLIKSDIKNKNSLVRSGIALLSAHFEGFIKIAANYYVVYVSYQKKKNCELSNNFKSLKLKKYIKECGETEKTSVHTRLINKFENIDEDIFFIKYNENEKIIGTDANPKYNVILEILESIGLEYPEIELKKNYINFDLMKKRNEIVHGEKTFLNKSDFIETYENIMEIIDEFKDLVINAAEKKLYLKKN